MRLRRYLVVILFSCLAGLAPFSVTSVSAHGGGLDGDGGHNCRVGSCAGTYHCHQSRGPRCGGGSTYTTKPTTPAAFCISRYSARMSYSETRLMQVALFLEGFSPGPIDGIFGNRTSKAIRRYEIANGLKVSPNKQVYWTTLSHLGIDC